MNSYKLPTPVPAAPLFLYVEPLDDATKNQLVLAGYVPIQVTNLDAVKILQPEMRISLENIDVVAKAAFEAIARDCGGPTTTKFGEVLAKVLSK